MKIVAFYVEDSIHDRVRAISTKPIIDFISDVLYENKVPVDVFSASWGNTSKGIIRGSVNNVSQGINIHYGLTFGCNSRSLKIIRMAFSWIWLMKSIFCNTAFGEKIIVYHSMNIIIPVYLVAKLKKLQVTLYLGEFYQTVYKMASFKKLIENKFIKSAHSYICATNLLVNQISKIRTGTFQYVVLYGPYKKQKLIIDATFNNKKINLLYVGKISESKGIFRAIGLAKFLSSDYCIRIIGYGEDYELGRMRAEIDKSNRENECKVIFDGIKIGEDYIRYVQSCEIGLVLQDMNAEYNPTSFPSKILSFLSNGIEVIAPAIKNIAESPFSSMIHLYNSQDNAEIALLIRDVTNNLRNCDPRMLDELRIQFSTNLLTMLEHAN